MNRKKILFVFLAIIILQPMNFSAAIIEQNELTDKELPPPYDIDMKFEVSICRRMSVREFTEEPINDEQLSTILWAAFGLREDKTHTISAINSVHAAVIYVLNEEAVYTYDPINHTLIIYKEGDHRSKINILQYPAPIQIGLCWDINKADPNQAGIELGQIGQNIQFMANALNLGTVVTGQIPPAIDPIGIPSNHQGLIIMPLGHPKTNYQFNDKPLWISKLPKIQESQKSLSQVLKTRKQTETFQGELTSQEFSQILWSGYGFSRYIDQSQQEPIHLKRHRTVPSAHGYYPLEIYLLTDGGLFFYQPNLLTDILASIEQIGYAPVDSIGLPILTFVKQISKSDLREELGIVMNHQELATAPLILIPTLNLDKAKELSIESAKRFWYFEAGAVSQNVLLEACAWDASAGLIYPVEEESIQSLFNFQDHIIPMIVIPVGK
jgi:nitroreductase